jgi:hypothetical protein
MKELFKKLYPNGRSTTTNIRPLMPSLDNQLDLSELLLNQDSIDKAMIYKIKRQENTFVHVVEADRKDVYLLYHDCLPFFKTRMRLWGSYL